MLEEMTGEMLQILPYFWIYKKFTQFFPFSILSATFIFPPYDTAVLEAAQNEEKICRSFF